MLRRTLDWLDSRTDYRQILAPLRNRILPQGPSWWYTSAGCMFWLFVVQVVTGLLLMATYSPALASAWASVHFIEQSRAGSFLRGVHYYATHAMLLLFAVHVARVLVSGAFRAPRELIWATGLLLLPLTLALAITGNPLTASQKAVAQIEVEGNIIASTPVIGPLVKRILLGGEEVGQLTFTHLYFLHVGLLPLLVFGLLAIHITQVYKHGLARSGDAPLGPRARPYWPHQTVRNMLVLSTVLGAISYLAWAHRAPLDAPAGDGLASAPRPEWYFRWVFELRRYFTGDLEFVATIVVPGAILLVLLAIPALDHWLRPRLSLAARVGLVAVGLGGIGWLTWESFRADWNDADYVATLARADAEAERARFLADHFHVPPGGAGELLRGDPLTQGPLLFARHCASCHPHTDPDGQGVAASEPSAPNLYRFASREWIRGLLDPRHAASERYFGKTKMAEGEMVVAMRDLHDAADEEDRTAALQRQLDLAAAALSAEAKLDHQAELEAREAAQLDEGRTLIGEGLGCADCHKFGETGDLGSAPDLTGYGSKDWLRGMISNPGHERFYADDRNDRMPSFHRDPARPSDNLLSPRDLNLLIDWLRGEWRREP